MIHTIYRQKHFKTTEDGEKYWHDTYNFYEGERDFDKGDWRMCEVPGKRKDNKRIGVADVERFPIQYPLTLTNGEKLFEIEFPVIPINE